MLIDIISKTAVVPLIIKFTFHMDFQAIYTAYKFKEFQKKVKMCKYCKANEPILVNKTK